MRILGFGGSLRKGSWNRSLLFEAQNMLPEGFELDLSQLDVIGRLPLFNQDLAASEHVPLDKLVLVPEGVILPAADIRAAVEFQERFFESVLFEEEGAAAD